MDPGKYLPSLLECIDGKEEPMETDIMITEVIGPTNKLNQVQIVPPKIAQNVIKNPKCKVRIANSVDGVEKPKTSAVKEVNDKLKNVQIVAPNVSSVQKTLKIATPVSQKEEKQVDKLEDTSDIVITDVIGPINDKLYNVQVRPKIVQETPKCTVKIANSVDAVKKPKTSAVKEVNDKLNKVQIVAPNVSSAQKSLKIAIPVSPKTAATASNNGAQVVTSNSVLGGPYLVSIPPNSNPTKTPNPALPVLVANENGQLVLKSGTSTPISGLKMVSNAPGTPTLMSLGENGQYFVALNPTSSGVSLNLTPSLVTEKVKVIAPNPTALNNSLSNATPKIPKKSTPKVIKKKSISNDKSPKKLSLKNTPKNKKNWTPVGGIKLSNLKAKLFKNNTDKQLMNSYSCLEKSYLKTNKISKMRLEKLKQLKAHYKNTLNKITDLCASINFAAENLEALFPYTSIKRQGSHRWSFDERIIAISLLRKSPVSYQILRPVFNLPSRKCLRYSLDKQNCRAGVNKFIFNALKSFVAKLDPLDKICCLSFDQMELKVHTQFDSHFDKILGLVDMGFQQGRSQLCGDHILVFELKSLRKKWSMPIAYFFTKGEVQSQTLRRLIVRIIGECQAIGVDILSTSCPMYDNFRATMVLIGADKSKPMFEFQEKIITTIYDPSHLLVLSRDELYRNDVSMNICIDGDAELLSASWNHIQQAYETDCKNTFPKLYKIKKTDLDPVAPCSNMIKQAARCLSNSVASVINQQVITGLFDKETLATAHYVGKLNETFDSLNGTSSKARGARGLKCHLQKMNEDHHTEFWIDTSRDIETWTFSNGSYVPDGWITTLRGILALWTNLKEKGFTCLELKQFSNDSLRSMFKGMKSFYKTSMLNFTQFEEAFKNCANNYLINIHGGMDPYAFNNHKLFTTPLKGYGNKLPRKLKPDKAFKKHNLQFSKNFLKCFSLCHIVKTIGSLLSHQIKCSKCLFVLFDNDSGFKDEGFVIKSNEEILYPSQNLIQSISSCVNDYEACMPKHMHKDRISLPVLEELSKKFKSVWLKQACPTHFKALSKDIIHMTFESMSLWWGQKLAKDHNQLITPAVAKKRTRTRGVVKKKPKVSYYDHDKFVDESNIEETIIDFPSPSKYHSIMNSIMPDF